MKSVAHFRLIELLQWHFSCRWNTHTPQEPDSRSWCHTVVSLQFTYASSGGRACERILLLLVFIA